MVESKYDQLTREELLKMATFGNFPEDFDRWELCDENGWTITHEAAKYDNLPKDFDQWDLVVAHIAAIHGNP